MERDADSTRAIYGSDVPFKTILLGDVAAPAQADPLLRAVEDISHQARAQEATEQAPADQKKEDQK